MWRSDAGRAASAVLSRPGAVAKLLAIAAKSPDVDVFADSMVAALGSTTLLETASLDEMKLLLEQVPYISSFGLLMSVTALGQRILQALQSSSMLDCPAIHVLWRARSMHTRYRGGSVHTSALQSGLRPL